MRFRGSGARPIEPRFGAPGILAATAERPVSHRFPTSHEIPPGRVARHPEMQTHLILSAIATDDPRGLESLVRAVHECGCGIREARLVRFGDHVGIVAGVSGNWNAVAKLDDALARLDGEEGLRIVSSRSSRSDTPAEAIPYLAEVTGVDRPGVLAQMVRFFSERDISIEDFHADDEPHPARRDADRVGPLHRRPARNALAGHHPGRVHGSLRRAERGRRPRADQVAHRRPSAA